MTKTFTDAEAQAVAERLVEALNRHLDFIVRLRGEKQSDLSDRAAERTWNRIEDLSEILGIKPGERP